MYSAYSIFLILILSYKSLCQTVENTDREKRHIDKHFTFHKTLDFGNKIVHREGSFNVGPGGFSHEKHIKIIKNNPPPSSHQEFQGGFSHFGHAQSFHEVPQQFNDLRMDPIQNTQIFFNNQNSQEAYNPQNNHVQNSGVSGTQTVEIEKIHSFNVKKSDQFFSSTTKTLRSSYIHPIPPHHAKNNFDHIEVGGIFGINPGKQQMYAEIEDN